MHARRSGILERCGGRMQMRSGGVGVVDHQDPTVLDEIGPAAVCVRTSDISLYEGGARVQRLYDGALDDDCPKHLRERVLASQVE